MELVSSIFGVSQISVQRNRAAGEFEKLFNCAFTFICEVWIKIKNVQNTNSKLCTVFDLYSINGIDSLRA